MKNLPWDVKIPKIFSVLATCLILIALVITTLFRSVSPTYAAPPCEEFFPAKVGTASPFQSITIKQRGLSETKLYPILFQKPGARGQDAAEIAPQKDVNGVPTFNILIDKEQGTVNGVGGPGHGGVAHLFKTPGTITVKVTEDRINALCENTIVVEETVTCKSFNIQKTGKQAIRGYFEPEEKVSVTGTLVNLGSGQTVNNLKIIIRSRDKNQEIVSGGFACATTNSSGQFAADIPIKTGTPGSWTLTIVRALSGECQPATPATELAQCQARINVAEKTDIPEGHDPDATPIESIGDAGASKPIFCNNETGIETAIGCIPIRDTTAFVAFLLRWSIGIAGGIAFLLMLFAAFQIMTSAGNPERLQGGRELLVAAISGLILIIFSVFLLRLIGVEILQLPGF